MPESLFYVFFAVLLGLFGWMFMATKKKIRDFYRGIPTLGEYRQLHPNAKNGDGVPTCHQCNVSNIHLLVGGNVNIHQCRLCGSKLWRS